MQSGRELAEVHESLQIPCFPNGRCHGDFYEASHNIQYALKPQLVYLNLFFSCSWQAGRAYLFRCDHLNFLSSFLCIKRECDM